MTYAVELRTHSISEDGLIPHTFLMVTGPGGTHGYGFAPLKTGLTGAGSIHDDTNHAFT